MKEMTKTQISERQAACWNRIDELDELSKTRELTAEEVKEQRSLIDESAKLSTRAKALASGVELANIRSREDKGKELRSLIEDCFVNKRGANATTILANAVTTGGDQNTTANLDAGGLIPIEIQPIIDTKVPGIELPDDLKMLTGVTGTQVIPYSINDVKFSVEGEVTKVAEQALDFTNITTSPKRVAASVPVSRRAVANAAFDIVAFVTYKFQKGWAIFRAQHIYGHGDFDKLDMPFAKVDIVELTLDENIGKNIAKEIAAMYDLGFEGDPELIMDKTTEVDLKFTKLIPGTTDSNRTVIEGGKCLGHSYTVSPYIDFATVNNAPKADGNHYIGIGHWGYLAFQQHGKFRATVDATSAEVAKRNTTVLTINTEFSITELSQKVNGANGVQAFKLLKVVEGVSNSDI